MNWLRKKQYYRRETDPYRQTEKEIIELLKETIFYLKIIVKEIK